MTAYKGHMQKVQKELEILKKKTDEAGFIIKKDERVRKLESQISWFREEALHLANQIQDLKKENINLKEKCTSL